MAQVMRISSMVLDARIVASTECTMLCRKHCLQYLQVTLGAYRNPGPAQRPEERYRVAQESDGRMTCTTDRKVLLSLMQQAAYSPYTIRSMDMEYSREGLSAGLVECREVFSVSSPTDMNRSCSAC